MADLARLTPALFTGADLPDDHDLALEDLREWERFGVTHVIDTRIEWSDEELVVGTLEGAAQILLGLRDALCGMIVHDEAEVWPTVLRLRDEGFDDERIHKMLLGTAVDHLMPQMADPDRDPDQGVDAESFMRALAELPDDPRDLDDDWEDDPLEDLEWQVEEWLESEQPDRELEDDIASTLRGALHDELMAACSSRSHRSSDRDHRAPAAKTSREVNPQCGSSSEKHGAVDPESRAR